jgi:hypothetical protein
MVLDAEPRIEQPEVLRDLRDRGHGRLARAARDALLDRDGRRDAGQTVDGRPRELLHKLPGVRGHRFHETPLALGEDDVESERGFARAGDTRDD